MSHKPIGFNLIAPVSNSLGLGQAARTTARLLSQSGYDFVVTDWPDPDHAIPGRHGFESKVASIRSMPYGINLVQLEPQLLAQRLSSDWMFAPFSRRLNALVPFWELSKLPDPWVSPLQAVDYVLAPTRHIERAVRRADPSVPILEYPQAVYVPDTESDKERWGLAGKFSLLISFDARSDVDRKNPNGAIKAFRAAFGAESDVCLIVRMRNADEDPRYADLVTAIRSAALDDERIQLMEQDLPFNDLMSLYASVDALISLHRAEGLGLVIMECMSLGTPAIATAWSGNMDYMNDTNSALVGYDLVRAGGRMDYYRADYMGTEAQWAEPDLGQAVEWLRRLKSDRALLEGLGLHARESMVERRRLAQELPAFRGLAEEYSAAGIDTARHRAAVRYIHSRRREGLARALTHPQWAVGGAMRKARSVLLGRQA